MKTETTITYVNLIQTAFGIEFDAVEDRMTPALVCSGDKYIATYAIPGSYTAGDKSIRKKIVEPILHSCQIGDFSARNSRRIAEKALHKFRIENPLGALPMRTDAGVRFNTSLYIL